MLKVYPHVSCFTFHFLSLSVFPPLLLFLPLTHHWLVSFSSCVSCVPVSVRRSLCSWFVSRGFMVLCFCIIVSISGFFLVAFCCQLCWYLPLFITCILDFLTSAVSIKAHFLFFNLPVSLFLHLGPFLMSCDPNNKWNEDLNLNGVFLCLVNTSKIYFKCSHDIMTHKGIHFSCTCLFSCECGWPHFVHYQGPPYHSYWACKGHELVFNVNSGSSQGQRGWGWCVLHCSATYH